MATPATCVFHPPMMMPSVLLGRPSCTTDMSDVVPPISTIRLSGALESTCAPVTDAAGPDRMVSTGLVRASSADISVPSLRTTETGTERPRSSSAPSIASRKSSMTGTSRALRSAVAPRPMTLGSTATVVASTTSFPNRSFRKSAQLCSTMAPLFSAYKLATPNDSAFSKNDGLLS